MVAATSDALCTIFRLPKTAKLPDQPLVIAFTLRKNALGECSHSSKVLEDILHNNAQAKIMQAANGRGLVPHTPVTDQADIDQGFRSVAIARPAIRRTIARIEAAGVVDGEIFGVEGRSYIPVEEFLTTHNVPPRSPGIITSARNGPPRA